MGSYEKKMALVKYLVVYSVFALAVVSCQSNNEEGNENQCYTCSSDENSVCTNDELDTEKMNALCTGLTSACGTYTFKNFTGTYTYRGCDVDCNAVKTTLKYDSSWNCTTCNEPLCNIDAIIASDKCVKCTSNSSEANSTCTNSAVNTTVVTETCDKGDNACGTYTFQDSGVTYTYRDCDVNCTLAKNSLKPDSAWTCATCNSSLCNVDAIAVPDQCVKCTSNSSDPYSKCANSAVNTTVVTETCDKGNNACGAYTFKDSTGTYTHRGCDVNCTLAKESLNYDSAWNCATCDSPLCNVKVITVPDQCVKCTGNSSDANSTCTNSAVNTTIVTETCDKGNNACGAYTFKESGVTYTHRGCDVNCTSAKGSLKYDSAWNCTTCNSDQCNAEVITVPDQCVKCTGNSSDANSTCTNSAVNTTIVTETCDKGNNACGAYTFKESGVTYTHRGCDVNCTSAKGSLKYDSAWNCATCDSPLCNVKVITVPDQCVKCTSNSSDANSTCTNSAVNTTVVTETCDKGDTCGTYTYQDSGVTYTYRGCDVNCASAKNSLKYDSAWNCATCDSPLCNVKVITVPDQCVKCTSNSSDANSKCTNSVVNTTVVTETCDKGNNACGTYTFQDSGVTYTYRGCDVNCTSAKDSLKYESGWNCTTCTSNLCDVKEIISSGSRLGFSFVTLLLSGIVALNCY